MQINNFNKSNNMTFGTQLKLWKPLSELEDITPDNVRNMLQTEVPPNKITGLVTDIVEFGKQISADNNPKAILSIAPNENMLRMLYSSNGDGYQIRPPHSIPLSNINIETLNFAFETLSK